MEMQWFVNAANVYTKLLLDSDDLNLIHVQNSLAMLEGIGIYAAD